MNSKHWLRSKTVWFNALGFLALALPEVATLPGLEAYQQHIAVTITLVNLALRFVTTQPVGAGGR